MSIKKTCLIVGGLLVLLSLIQPAQRGLGMASAAEPPNLLTPLGWEDILAAVAPPNEFLGGFLDSSVALNNDNLPAVSYFSSRDSMYGQLIYSHLTSQGWLTETVDPQGGMFNELAIDSLNRPHLAYYEVGPEGNLKHAYFTEDHWAVEIITAGVGIGGSYFDLSLELDANDRPAVAYSNYYQYDPETQKDSLWYAHFTGANWDFSRADDGQGRSPTMVLDALGLPHISYYGLTNNLLYYTTLTNSTWLSETIALGGAINSLALDSLGRPHLVYTSYGSSALNYAWWSGSQWLTDTLPVSVSEAKLVLDSQDQPHIAYVEYVLAGSRPASSLAFYNSGKIGYATRSEAGWQILTVSSVNGYQVNLALDHSDRPYISYTLYLAAGEAGTRDLRLVARAPLRAIYMRQLYLPVIIGP